MTTIGVDLAEPGSEFTVYTIDGVNYRVRPEYYLASCDHCGWIGSSEECSSGMDHEECICPKCYSTGADCGKVAERAEHLADIKQREPK